MHARSRSTVPKREGLMLRNRGQTERACTSAPFRAVLTRSRRSSALLYQNVSDPLPEKPEDALDHPAFKLSHAVEVVNGGTADEENEFAMHVAEMLHKPLTGGSDAHSAHGLGKFVTAFNDEINNESEFLSALHAGAFYPAVGLRTGNIRPYTV